MKLVIGEVTSNIDGSESGEFQARFENMFDGEPQWVTYTSPYFKINGGGLVAIPEYKDQILAVYNEDILPGQARFYYHSTIVKNKPRTGTSDPENFEALRSSDVKAKIYNASSQPVTQTFTNSAGAGMYIQRDFSKSKISNNVTVKSENDNEINVGSIGIQLRNNEGDSIVLNGSESNDYYAGRSFGIETFASQEYKCTSSDIKMKVVDGGDINILNDSTGAYGIDGKWYGNVRLKSRYRNIDLAALGDESYVNIFTQGATIQVDSQGTVKIFGQGSIQLESPQDISLNAGGNVDIYGGDGVQIGSGGVINSAGTVQINSVPIEYIPQSASKDDVAVQATPTPGAPPAGTQFVPNDYNDPTGSV